MAAGAATWQQTAAGILTAGRGEARRLKTLGLSPLARSQLRTPNQYQYSKCCCQESQVYVDEESVKSSGDGREGGQTTSAGLQAPAHEAVRHLGSGPDTVQLRSKVGRRLPVTLTVNGAVVCMHVVDCRIQLNWNLVHSAQVQTYLHPTGQQDANTLASPWARPKSLLLYDSIGQRSN